VFALTEEQKRELIAAGAAAGIAASFNAPIGGMLFAIEVIIGRFRMRYLQVIVVASVVASVTARELVGGDLIFTPPPYRLDAPQELLFYVAVGLAAVGVGLALARGEDLATRVFDGVRVWPPLRTAFGGLLLGGIALVMPEVLGTGDDLPPVPGAVHEPIAAMLDGTFAVSFGMTGLAAAGLLVLLLAAKLVATCISIGSGFSVGSFGPAFFLGAALGGAVAHAAAVVMPGAPIRPGALALVGMAAVLGAAARAPLTGIIIVFEVTGDYGMVLPLMLATGVSTFLAERLSKDSLYTLPLRRRGIVYGEPEDIDILQTVQVGEIMTHGMTVVPEDLPLDQLHRQFRRFGPHGYPVVAADDSERLVGVVTVSDLAEVTGEDTGDVMGAGITAGDVCTRRPLTVTPEDPVFRAVQRMASMDVGRLPVVSAEDHTRLLGMVRRADVVKAYQRALARNVDAQHRLATSQLRDLPGTRFLELVVDARSRVAGLRIRDIQWPPRTIVVSLRRDARVVTPGGDTEVLAGDVVLVLTGAEHVETVRSLLAGESQVTGDESPDV
jgi:chloride channel protein, CIC family